MSAYDVYIGIDVGRTGAICVLSPELQIVQMADYPLANGRYKDAMPSYRGLKSLLTAWEHPYVMIEKIAPFRSGELAIDWSDEVKRDNYLTLKSLYDNTTGFLAGLGVRWTTIAPFLWRSEFHLLTAGQSYYVNKHESLNVATEQWPDYTFTRSDQAEAALIGLYGYRTISQLK